MLRCIVVLTIVLVANRADAQIVNVQGQLAKAPETDDVIAQFETKLDWRTGNNPLLQIGGSAALMVHEGKFLGLVVLRGEYGESRGVTLSRKSFEHARARYRLGERWRWEGFLQHEFDAFRRLAIRAIAGTGPALQIVNDKAFGLLAGAAYMFEFEQLDNRMDTVDAGDRTIFHRASFYLTGVEKVGTNLAIVQTLYAQPRLDEPSDFRLLGELSISIKLSKRIALTDGFTLAYDRTPPDGIERLDSQLKVGLIAQF